MDITLTGLSSPSELRIVAAALAQIANAREGSPPRPFFSASAPLPEASAAPLPETPAAPSAPPPAASLMTLTELRQALMGCAQSKGEALRALLIEKFDVKNLSELRSEQYSEVLTAAQEL